ncbi:MAG: beta-ketoacyl-[acyl-carrier-protein] synthase family protein [Bacteroidales bacterium]
MKRVVITGIGIHSSIGTNIEEVTTSLKKGKSGIAIDNERILYGYNSPLVGLVPPVGLKDILPRNLRVNLSEAAEYAYVATKQALDSAKIDDAFLEQNEIGIIYGNDSSVKEAILSHEKILKYQNTSCVGSGAIFRTMNSSISMNLSTIFRLKGINMTISAACASGALSIGQGFQMIRDGLQDIIICGGGQEINHYALASFDALKIFSQNTENPVTALRPFDIRRNGLVPSGGAATLIIEEYDHAQSRGAQIYAEIIGYGFSSNGVGISEPSVDGAKRAMKRAIDSSNVPVNRIDYINAHATSTPKGDAAESIAIKELFRSLHTPISSTKSMTGHECWMAGASELIYTIIMMQESFIAPNINFEIPDEYSTGLNIISQPTPKNLNICLSNSFGFGGTNSTLIIKKL